MRKQNVDVGTIKFVDWGWKRSATWPGSRSSRAFVLIGTDAPGSDFSHDCWDCVHQAGDDVAFSSGGDWCGTSSGTYAIGAHIRQ